MTSRTLVTSDELLAWLNTELRKADDCETSSFDSIQPLRQPDEKGSNWSEDVSIRWGPDVSIEDCSYHVRRIIAEARKRFNLA